MMKLIFYLLIPLILLTHNVSGQFSINTYTENGISNVSEGFYCNAALQPAYTYKNYKVEAGILCGISSVSERFFKSFYAGASAQIFIKKIHFCVEGGYISSYPSKELRESNYLGLLGYISKHFTLKLGYNYRTYKFSNKTIRDLGIPDNRVHEPFNIMYRLSYNVKKEDSKWNLETAISNYDYCYIQQTTNPMLDIKFTYKPVENLTLFSETLYKNAGILNLSANYFALSVKTGIVWELNKH
jgi:hypothetical protein